MPIVFLCAILQVTGCPQTFSLPVNLRSPIDFFLCVFNLHLEGLWEESGLRSEDMQLGRAREGRDKGTMAEVGTMPQVSCTLSGCWCLTQKLGSDSCCRTVLQVHADRAWLPSVKFHTWELEAHYELKVTFLKQKYVWPRADSSID